MSFGENCPEMELNETPPPDDNRSLEYERDALKAREAELAAEVQRLHAIVTTLPKTVDGLTITLGMNVFVERLGWRAGTVDQIGREEVLVTLERDRPGHPINDATPVSSPVGGVYAQRTPRKCSTCPIGETCHQANQASEAAMCCEQCEEADIRSDGNCSQCLTDDPDRAMRGSTTNARSGEEMKCEP
jgi:hypothetical protein